MINTGCKYPDTPEPCEGYREAMEVLDNDVIPVLKIMARETSLVSIHPKTEQGLAKAALTRINRLKGIDQLREKE